MVEGFRRRVRVCAIAAAALLALLPAARAQDDYQTPSKVNVAWNQLHNYDEMVSICRELAAAYPELLTVQSLGKSVQGRDILLLTLNNPETGPDTAKPAMYIDGNIHGNEVQAAETVLYSVWYLAKSYGAVPQLTALMDRCAFYFVPTANPDGRAYWFDQPNTMNTSRSGLKPVDNDGDGLFDEDPPNDLDGDGELLLMRRRNPNGRFRANPDDPRVLERVPRDAQGEFERYDILGLEGIDDDNDGRVNEDGPGGYDPNRNWPATWMPDFVQYGAGDYPLSLPESKAIADFVVAHPNIAAVQAYHNAGGMILRGPGFKGADYPRADLRVYDAIGERGEKILPHYRYLTIWKDLYPVFGGFVNWTYEDLGIISFTNELWTGRKYNLDGKDPNSAERMRFNDDLRFGQDYVPWKKFNHPTYGEIELGGWRKMTGRVPPAFMLEEEAHRNFAFTIFHARQMPQVALRDVDVTPLDGGLYRVRVDVCNEQLIPTVTAQGAARRYGPRDFIEIGGEGLRVLAGGTLDDRFDAPFEFVEHLPQKLWIDNGIPGDGCRTFQWVVAGQGEATIRFSSPRAIDVATTVKLGE